MWTRFKSKHHDEDQFEVEHSGVRIAQTLVSGGVTEIYLTKEALEELYKESQKETI
jgi:hypothetical protein